MSETYEGWANQETWQVANDIDNDAASLDDAVLDARWALRGVKPVLDLSRGMKIKARLSGMAEAVVERVNWRELAEHYMTKAREGVA